ncbi:MAG: hypothetical protein ACRD0Z_10415 [Acidimicrobiales bacterium]
MGTGPCRGRRRRRCSGSHSPNAGELVEPGDGVEFCRAIKALVYETTALGIPANRQGTMMVDGAPTAGECHRPVVGTSADHRAGKVGDESFQRLVKARGCRRFCANRSLTKTATSASPAWPSAIVPSCASRSGRTTRQLGTIPVTSLPPPPAKLRCQSSVTIAPDVGARHGKDLSRRI